MGDMGEYWRDVGPFLQERAKKRRRSNMESSTEILRSGGIPFESKNNGIHLIVMDRWDYWPSTGLFIDRRNGKRGRGVFKLLKQAQQVQSISSKQDCDETL